MKTTSITNSPSQTKKRGEMFAKKILKRGALEKGALILGLEGDLGGGKTTFTQGFAKGLGIKEKILSPTFIILKKFPIQNSWFEHLYHIDCYRIENSKEILKLGFQKILSNPKNIIIIEWVGKIRKELPRDAPILRFEFQNQKKRKIILEGGFKMVELKKELGKLKQEKSKK